MACRRLADFLEVLDREGDVARVEPEVVVDGEVAEIARRSVAGANRALLLGHVRHVGLPVVVNLLAHPRRIALLLGVKSVDEAAARLATLLDPQRPEGWFERLKTSPRVAALGSIPPREVRAGAAQQVVRLGSDVDLGELPLLRHDADEPAPAITAATLLSVDPDSGAPVSMRCPLLKLAADQLGPCWADDEPIARLWQRYRQRRETMPLAAVLGGDPLLSLVTSLSLPPGVDAIRLAGLLRESPLDVVRCRSLDLWVPAEAEFVVEGRLKPSDELVEVGNVLDESGFHLPARLVTRMRITAMTSRAQPVYHAIVPGPAPGEETAMRQSMARLLLPLAKLSLPELVDYALPRWAAARQAVVLAVDKWHAGQGRQVVHQAWSLPWLKRCKLIVVVDASVDPSNETSVLAAVANHVAPDGDVWFDHGPANSSDPMQRPGTLNSRMAIDATRKLPDERARHPMPPPLCVDEEMARRVTSRWPELGIE